MKVRKSFDYWGITLKIVEREEPYLNSPDPVIVTRVLAPNGGIIPIHLQHKQTLKSIAEETTKLLDSFKARGCDVRKELTDKLT